MSSPNETPPRPPPGPSRRNKLPDKSDRGLSDQKRISICQQLLKGVEVKYIAIYEQCSPGAVYNVRKNLMVYGNVRAPPSHKLGAKLKLREEDVEALYNEIIENGWMSQSRICQWLRVQRGITISQSSVSRLFEDKGWTERSLRPFIKQQTQPQPEMEDGEEEEDEGYEEQQDRQEPQIQSQFHGQQCQYPPLQFRDVQQMQQHQGQGLGQGGYTHGTSTDYWGQAPGGSY